MIGNNLEIEQHAAPEVLRVLAKHRCVGCGECCRWPGQVILYPDDIGRIAAKLRATRENFLRRHCVVVWWTSYKGIHFRVALARKQTERECLFLDGSKCSIHEFKPVKCRAGPAGWSWISNPDAFWYYVRNSPSFSHDTAFDCGIPE